MLSMASYPLLRLSSFHPKCSKSAIKTATFRCVMSDKNPPNPLIQYELKRGQCRVFHALPSGLKLEVLVQKSNRQKYQQQVGDFANPPLVFVHGSYHASWCRAEHWMPYFSENGFDCYAVSLLGQGESDVPRDSVAGSLQTHASDVASFIRKELSSPPVLLGHSFGGLILQYYIAYMGKEESYGTRSIYYPDLAGAVLMCSVPPSGNSGIVWRYLFTKPVTAFKVTRSLAAKGFQTSLPLCKETFFSSEMEDHVVQRYQELMKVSSAMPLFDMRKLNASLPVPSGVKPSLDILVLGASNDYIVDEDALNETARFYDVTPVRVEGVAHDIMLDCCWEKGAVVILSWLKQLLNRLLLRVFRSEQID